jgi:ABC-type uncharacterized transport system involved in gliding motility auxiliary subunit
MAMMGGGGPSPEFIKLLKSWGIEFDPTKVAGDISHARRVQFGGGVRPVVTEYVGWLGLDRSSMDEKDVLSGGVERLNFGTPGFLTKAEGSTTQVTPIVVTSPQAMQIAAEKFSGMPDPLALLRAYKPEGKPLTLAARVSGTANSAFPEGAPKPPKKEEAEKKEGDDKAKAEAAQDAKKDAKADAKEEPKQPKDTAEAKPKDDKPKQEKAETAPPAKPHVPSGKVNVIVVADADLLNDQFWVDVREFMGQQVAIPNASNAAFVVNALDNLSGSEALIALRGRGAEDRPFKLVNELRRDAERRYREKEQALTTKLKEVQDQLAKLEKAGEGGSAILSENDRQAIERFRGDMLSIRRELREVKRALRQDIDRLDGWLKFANIALVPLLIGIGGVAWTMRHRRRAQPRAGDAGEDKP